MTRSIDNKETGDLVLLLAILIEHCSLGLDGLRREVGGTNLLCDTTSFTFLDVGLTNLHVDCEYMRQGVDINVETHAPCREASSFQYRRVQGYSK